MPTFSSQQVSVTSQTLTTTLSLEEILERLLARAPKVSTREPGWTGIDEHQQRLTVNGTPSEERPAIWPAEEFDIPERIAARFAWWTQSPIRDLDIDYDGPAERPYLLDAADVLISKIRTGYQLLWSTQVSSLINPPGGNTIGTLVTELLARVRESDDDAMISGNSVLEIPNRELYLWLTLKSDTKKPIGEGVTIHDIIGMSTDEKSGRGDRGGILSGAIDLERVSFISAIATGVKLGPAIINFTEPELEGKMMRTCARVWGGGTFKLRLTESKYNEAIGGLEERLRAAQLTAYRYIPLALREFENDNDWTRTTRDDLLVDKQMLLSKIFLTLAEANPRYQAWQQRKELEQQNKE